MPTRQIGTPVPRSLAGTGVIMPKTGTSKELWKRVGELAGSSAFLLYLADVASDRLSLTQAAFFMLAATADAAGKPATRSTLIATYSDTFRGSIRNSYRQLLEPTRVYPKGLGWLTTERNPNDDREQMLVLTEEGRKVILGALMALEPMLDKVSKRTH